MTTNNEENEEVTSTTSSDVPSSSPFQRLKDSRFATFHKVRTYVIQTMREYKLDRLRTVKQSHNIEEETKEITEVQFSSVIKKPSKIK